MTDLQNMQVFLRSRLVGLPTPLNWRYSLTPVRELMAGEILVKVLMLSIDPAMRGWMNEGRSYIRPVGIGEVMRTGEIGQIIASKSPKFAVGDIMSGTTGVQQYWIDKADDQTANFRRIDPTIAPLPVWLNALGSRG